MPSYVHLSEDERDQIGVQQAAGRSAGAIARALGRARSTISRELRRNSLASGRYSPLHAAGAYLLRRQREAAVVKDRPLGHARWLTCVAFHPEGTQLDAGCAPLAAKPSTPSSTVQPRKPRNCGAILSAATSAAGPTAQDPRATRSRIVPRSTTDRRRLKPVSRPVIGRATSSSASAHGPCSFSMSANPA